MIDGDFYHSPYLDDGLNGPRNGSNASSPTNARRTDEEDELIDEEERSDQPDRAEDRVPVSLLNRDSHPLAAHPVALKTAMK